MDRALTEPVIGREGGRVRRAIFQWFSYQCINDFNSDKRKLEDWPAKTLKSLE